MRRLGRTRSAGRPWARRQALLASFGPSRLGAATILLVTLLSAAPAAACEVCFGSRANGSPLVTSARLGVFLLLGVTVVVLGGFARFFFYLRQRARQAESERIASEWAQLQRSSTPC